MSQDTRRGIPRTDDLLAEPRLVAAARSFGRERVKALVNEAQGRARSGEIEASAVLEAVVSSLAATPTSLTSVFNATGIVLHTNLGRAALSSAAIDALSLAAGYLDIEFDLAAGVRSRSRGAGAIDALTSRVPSASAAHIVNNGAAALALTATALAAGREIVISRGELVEIGDGFRLPDLITSTGARLREVGTTNRTSLADYADVIGPATAFILKVHPSNFAVTGFTSSVGIEELATLGLPVVGDIGSGLLTPDSLLPDEPDATTWIGLGATLVIASGDKLLGGPQAGIIVGAEEPITRIRRHPLARAMRLDKLRLAAFEATLRGPATPTYLALHADAVSLRARAAQVASVLLESAISVEVVPSEGAVGGGGAPLVALPGWALQLPEIYATLLRTGTPAVVGRIERGHCLVDLRCVAPADDIRMVDAIVSAAARIDDTC